MNCIRYAGRKALLLVGSGLLTLSCLPRDVLVTWEPDAYSHGQVLERGQTEVAASVSPDFVDLGYSLIPHHFGLGQGLGHGIDARLGWSRVGVHECGEESVSLWVLHAAEMRVRRQLLCKGMGRLNAGIGLDVIWGHDGSQWRYYGLRPMLQAAGGLFADNGLGVYLPLSVSYTNLRAREATGVAVTPGIGVAYEHRCFFIRAAHNAPIGSYFVHNDSLIRVMSSYSGIHLGGRFKLFQ